MRILILAALAWASGPAPGPYGGFPELPGLAAIEPEITLGRTGGPVPLVVRVGAGRTKAVGSAEPFDELEYSWDFGESGAELLTNPATGTRVDAGRDQRGPEAAYVYRNPGTYTITLTVRGWDGSKFVEARAKREVRATRWTGSTLYIDPEKGRDSADGRSPSRPKRSWAAIAAYLAEGGNAPGPHDRRVLIRAGTTLDCAPGIRVRNGQTRLRIAGYGQGPRPVLRAASDSGFLSFELDHGRDLEDIVVSDLTFDGLGRCGLIAASESRNRPPTAPYGRGRSIYLLDCRFTGSRRNAIQWQFYGRFGDAMGDCGLWRCDFDRGDTPGHGLYVEMKGSFFVVGGSFSGGKGDATLDHHVYSTVRGDALYRWVDFGPMRGGNFGINGNIKAVDPDTGRPNLVDRPRVLVDSCAVHGSQNGLDFSTNDNSSDKARFDSVIVQGCVFRELGRVGGQSLGITGSAVRRLSVRDATFLDVGRLADGRSFRNSSTDIYLTDPAAVLLVYRNTFEKAPGARSCVLSLGAGGTGSGGVVRDNVFRIERAGDFGGAIFTDPRRAEGWSVEGNRFEPGDAGEEPKPFVNPAGRRLSIDEWRAGAEGG